VAAPQPSAVRPGNKAICGPLVFEFIRLRSPSAAYSFTIKYCRPIRPRPYGKPRSLRLPARSSSVANLKRGSLRLWILVALLWGAATTCLMWDELTVTKHVFLLTTSVTSTS